MRRRYLPLVALLGASVAVLPAMASSPGSSTATVSGLESLIWSPMEVAITPGGTVTFQDTSASVPHGIVWTSVPATPACSGVPINEGRTNWKGTCTFAQEGVYEYDCYVHGSYMSGKVYVDRVGTMSTATNAPPSTPVTTTTTTTSMPGGAPPASGAPPGLSAPGEAQTGAIKPTAPADSLSANTIELAPSQRGARVRGSVQVAQSGSRLTVEAFAATAQLAGVAWQGDVVRLARARRSQPALIGRFARSSLPAGRASFSVTLDQRAARALGKRRHLMLTMRLTLTPPGGTASSRSLPVTVRAA